MQRANRPNILAEMQSRNLTSIINDKKKKSLAFYYLFLKLHIQMLISKSVYRDDRIVSLSSFSRKLLFRLRWKAGYPFSNYPLVTPETLLVPILILT